MASMDDKILGEKSQNYCSSSEDEDEGKKGSALKSDLVHHSERLPGKGAVHTGPKGVIADYQRFKQLETERKKEQEEEKRALAKKLAITCRTAEEDSKEDENMRRLEEELSLDDEFIRQYREERMKEMLKRLHENCPVFGTVQHLTKDTYVEAIDKEEKHINVVIHVYDHSTPGCEAMNGCMQCLAQEYPTVKFCCVTAQEVNVSNLFSRSGLPALLVYKGGNIIGNFVRITDQLGDDFYANELESFLQDHGLLPSKDEQKIIVDSASRKPGRGQESEDSDLDLD